MSLAPLAPLTPFGTAIPPLPTDFTSTRPTPAPALASTSTAEGIALVLSVGAFRGAAHVGVIRALERAGIPVDLVVGTSTGALAGVLYSAGLPAERLGAALRTLRLEGLFSPGVGPDGFTDMAPVRPGIEAMLGGPRQIENFPRRFACVAADAITGEAVVLNTGDAALAVQASMAIPGLVRPVRHGDRLLVDGAVVAPAPVSVARALGARVVVAVDVNVPRFGGQPARHTAEAINHGLDMAIQRLIALELAAADVVIRPGVATLKQDLGNVDALLRAGEVAGEAAVADIRRQLGPTSTPARAH